jgi:hypothetical protein
VVRGKLNPICQRRRNPQTVIGVTNMTFRPLLLSEQRREEEYQRMDDLEAQPPKAGLIETKPLPEEYAPYHLYTAFEAGREAYGRNWDNPYLSDRAAGVDAQAWDRGLEFAMRLRRWKERTSA